MPQFTSKEEINSRISAEERKARYKMREVRAYIGSIIKCDKPVFYENGRISVKLTLIIRTWFRKVTLTIVYWVPLLEYDIHHWTTNWPYRDDYENWPKLGALKSANGVYTVTDLHGGMVCTVVK